jgi:pimeloyl-ACP methyl ester carboxylesterase
MILLHLWLIWWIKLTLKYRNPDHPGMQYSKKYFELRSQFNSGVVRTDFSGSGINCHAFRFNSSFSIDPPKVINSGAIINNSIFAVPDEAIIENKSFTYYIFENGAKSKYRKAIILLHGLNERSWDKYLAWAFYLAEKTGHPVILFPIAFHMNRSPEAWGNPRLMQPLHNLRKQIYGDDSFSTFANVALSERLTGDPFRFFTSGQQSAADLVKLSRQINFGEHPLFEKAAIVNVFAYSIGAFLAQILFLANPEELFSKSKLFLFCGGAFFNEMNGVSKLIMDKVAFTQLRNLYLDEINQKYRGSESLADSMNKTLLGQAFLAMLAPGIMQNFRETRFQEIRNNIQAIALVNDNVIPANKIVNALGGGTEVEILDFPFGYSHETPFPLRNSLLFRKVDEAFKKVFSKAAHFLV